MRALDSLGNFIDSRGQFAQEQDEGVELLVLPCWRRGWWCGFIGDLAFGEPLAAGQVEVLLLFGKASQGQRAEPGIDLLDAVALEIDVAGVAMHFAIVIIEVTVLGHVPEGQQPPEVPFVV